MAYPKSVWIVLFLVAFNAGAAFIDTVGADDYLGIDTEVGDTSELEAAENQNTVQTGSGTGSTLFGTYNRMASELNTFFNAIMPGAEMLKNSGVPPAPVNFLFTMLALIPVIDSILFLRGLS